MRHPESSTIVDRMLSRCVETANGCWEWTGPKLPKGYGTVQSKHLSGGRCYTHRLSFAYFKADIPPGLFIDHLCRNTSCVNPDHLDAVTPRINTLRGDSPSARQARQTHCLNGHPLSDAHFRGRKRECRPCRAMREANRRERIKAAQR